MALVTPKMSLRVWDQLSDPYSHDQMADNWSKVDLHDHTPGRGIQIPTEGLANGAVTVAKAATALDPTGAYGAWKTISQADGFLVATNAANTYYFVTPGGQMLISGSGSGAIPATIPITIADYTVSGKTTFWRLSVAWLTNAAAPTSTFTFGLYPTASVAGGSGVLTPTLGTVVAGSTAALVAPALNSKGRVATSDFSIASDDVYIPGLVISVATVAANSVIGFKTLLQVKHV